MKFSIRDLFWLTVVVALVLGWWMDHRRWVPTDLTQREVEELERRNESLERYIDEIDRQLAEYKLQLDQQFYRVPGGGGSYIEVVPLDLAERERRDHLRNSSAPAPNPPKP